MQVWKGILKLAAPALLTFLLVACSNSQTPAPGVNSPENPNVNSVASASNNAPVPGSVAPATNPASSPPRIIFILDASGSMLGRVGQEEKMAVARRVLKDSITRLPENAEVGLIAYGHRRKNDCEDIEVLFQLKAIDKAAVSAQIDALKPSGMTPITNSLKQAFDIVKTQPGTTPVTVVLVSDGLETCKGDPCKFASDAKKAGLNFVLHVIGFDVGKLSVAQLECVAQAGNGLYLGAQNADELSAALAGAVAPQVVPDSRLSVKAIADGKLTDVVVNVRRAGSSEEVTGGRTYTAPDTNPRILPVPAGDYDVTVTAVNLSGAPTIKFESLRIDAGQTVEKTADFSAGELAVEVVRNGKPADALVQVYASGKSEVVAAGRTSVNSNPFKFRLLPGRYEVAVKSTEIAGGPSLRLTDIEVEGAKQIERTADFSTGTLRIGATSAGQLVDAVISVTNLATNKDEVTARTYASANTNPRTFELLPGRYRARLTAVKPAGLRPQEIIVEIKPGETLERAVEFSK